MRQFSCRITVCSEDTSVFQAFNAWITSRNIRDRTNNFRIVEYYRNDAQRPLIGQRRKNALNGKSYRKLPSSQELSLSKMRNLFSWMRKGKLREDNAWDFSEGTTWALVPSFGTHLIFMDGCPMIVERQQEERGQGEGSKRIETMTAIFPRSKARLDRYLEEIQAFNRIPEDQFMVYNHGSHSQHIMPRKKIDGHALVYRDQDVFKNLKNDMSFFLSSEDRYEDLNLHWHRGYGFFGPPGTGKTSMVMALASGLGLELHKLSLEHFTLDNFLHKFSRVKAGTILLFEDIDLTLSANSSLITINAPNPAGVPVPEQEEGMNYRTLLNIFDGLDTPEGLIFVITSNHKERIGDALLRPGRVDIHVDFELMGRGEAERYVSWFFKSDFMLNKDLNGMEISPAALRAICIANPLNKEGPEVRTYLEAHPQKEDQSA